MKFKKQLKLSLLLVGVLIFSNNIWAQNAPSLVSPEDGERCVETNSTFAWDTVFGAKLYRIQISSSSTFTNPDILNAVVPHPTSTFTLPGGLSINDNERYYWRVSASFTNVENFSPSRSFVTKGSPPDLFAPADQETCIDLEPTFSWKSMDSALSYHLQVSHSSAFAGNDLFYDNDDISSNTFSSTTFTIDLPQENKNYYWRVSASYTECKSDWSEPFMFGAKQNPPIAVNPEPNEVGISINTSLSWTRFSASATYDVDLASDNEFNNILQSFDDLSETTTTLTTLNYDSSYYWRVRSEGNGCESDWSQAYMFTTQYNAPDLDLPYDKRICLDLTYEFKWEKTQDAITYQLQIAEDPNFNDLVVNKSNLFDLFYEATLPQGLTTYYWRVRAKDENNFGAWSEVREFTTTVAPVEPIYPAKNTGGIPLETTFKWSDVTNGLGNYHFQLSESPSFADTLYDEPGLTSTTFSIALPENDKEYYWRVSASYSQCENEFPASPWSFKTVIPAPELIYPSDSAEDETFSIFFKWSEVEGADTYTFYLATTPNFTPLIYGENDLPVNQFFLPNLDPDTRYYWRVKAVNEDGESEFSETYTFTTSSRGPTVPEIQSPLIGAEQVELTVTLRWSEADRANAYHLQVVEEEANFDNALVDVDTLTTTEYALSDLENGTKYYWHVSAINDSGETRFSNLANFTTKLSAPTEEPVLLTPENNATNQSLRVVLSWESVTHATVYEVQVATQDNFTGDLFEEDTLNYATEKILHGLDTSTTYYWRVRGKNKTAKGPWCEAFQFTTKTGVYVDDGLAKEINFQAYPNPFSESTNLRFSLSESQRIEITAYNALGMEIEQIINKRASQGENIVKWNAPKLQSGIYYLEVNIGNRSFIKEIVILK